jgi:AcrR family transcriptional regulator
LAHRSANEVIFAVIEVRRPGTAGEGTACHPGDAVEPNLCAAGGCVRPLPMCARSTGDGMAFAPSPNLCEKTPMQDALPKTEGLRERNRRQTLQRIAEVGVELFLAKGYEATTLDEIAAAAGISRRTFFYYFRSKDDILLAHLGGYPEALKASVLESSSAGAPVDVVRDALLKLSNRFQSSRTIAIARLIRENDALRASRHGRDLELEQVLHEALCGLWPAKHRRESLRLVAMVSLGALRLAVDAWLEQDGKRPLVKYIQDAFKNLKAEI